MIASRLLLPLAFLPAGCGRDLPLQISLQDTWSGLELEAVEQAIDEWNSIGASRLREPGPVLDKIGRYHDEFDVGDLGDDMPVIYRISEPTPDYMKLESEVGEMEGYGTYGDVLILTFRRPLPRFCSEETFREYMPGKDYREFLREQGLGPEELTEECVKRLRALTLHELGHFIGLAHFKDRDGIMSNDEFPEPDIVHLTEADIGAFCIVYDCR